MAERCGGGVEGDVGGGGVRKRGRDGSLRTGALECYQDWTSDWFV